MQTLLLILAVTAVHAIPLIPSERETPEVCGYESCHKPKLNVLNVHIVPHTHDDVGWLKTVDQYYYGSRNNIQKAGVQYILDSVVKELWEDPDRRFIYVETAFFWKWWVRQSVPVQQKVHTLVRQGRLQFVGGAWSMNDEAATHYQSIIDQFTWGLSKLNKTFGFCGLPRVGWQIDPFGHSREFASLLAMMGYDGLFLGRIDYQDKYVRLKNKSMEMLWHADEILGKSSDIFTGALHNTYSPPPGFCFDILCSDEPIIDDPESPINNVDKKVNTFIDYVQNQAKYYRSKNIIITMGGDFTYQDATMWYTNLDKLIKYTNLIAAKNNLDIHAFYSTPNCYLKAVKDSKPQLPHKYDDFFPYASDSTAYWTGYFTSRPTTKYFEREANNYLQMVKQLQVLSNLNKHNQFVLNELRSAMGVMQHHDAITGTEKQHVTNDYVRLLNEAVDDAFIIAKQALNKATQNNTRQLQMLDFQRCHLNESRCEISETKERFIVTVYNSLSWAVNEPIRIPVPAGSYGVFGPMGNELKIQMVDLPSAVTDIPNRNSNAIQEIVFIAFLKPLSYKSFYVKKYSRVIRKASFPSNDYFDMDKYYEKPKNTEINYPVLGIVERIPNSEILKKETSEEDIHQIKKFVKVRNKFINQKFGEIPKLSEDEMRMLSDDPRIVERVDDVEFENEYFKLSLDETLGQLKQVKLPDESRLNLSINMYYYPGAKGRNTQPADRASGAYIFRPNATNPTKLKVVKTQTIFGNIVQEFRVNLHPAGHLNTKVYSNLNYIENEFIVGPIPIDDNIGKEYIIKYETNIINNGEFYTDSNGRQIIKRKLNFRPQWNLTLSEPIAGNYYPITNEIYIKNDDLKVSVLTDRSEGGTSLVEGEIELMVHRRLLYDDAFGVGEALNETVSGVGIIVRGKHRIMISKPNENIKKSILTMHTPPVITFSDAENLKYEKWLKLKNCYSFIKNEMPYGIHLLTLEPWDDKLLIRLENYLDEQPSIEINITNIFNNIIITKAKETMLAGNIWADDYKKWVWNNENVDEIKSTGLNIVLKSKEIKTLIADYEIINTY